MGSIKYAVSEQGVESIIQVDYKKRLQGHLRKHCAYISMKLICSLLSMPERIHTLP
jgi:hypothetical protein